MYILGNLIQKSKQLCHELNILTDFYSAYMHYAEHCMGYRRHFRLYVCLSVRHLLWYCVKKRKLGISYLQL